MANGAPRARDYAWPAYVFLRTELGALAALIVPAIVMVVVVGVVAGAQNLKLVKAFAAVFAFLVFAQYARVVYTGLLDGRRPSPIELLSLDRTTVDMAWISLVTSMATAVPMIPFVMGLGMLGASAGGEPPGAASVLPVALLGLAGVAGVAYVGARLVFALVLVAAKMRGRRIATAWQMSRGHTWLIVKIGVLTVLPLGLLGEVVGRLGGDEDGGLLPAVVTQSLAGMLNLAAVGVAAHALVALYRDLTASPSPPAVTARAA